MPELDGFETAALIRERERFRYTPIIFVTAVRREEEHILKGYAQGAVDYVVKPFAPETMIAKVRFFLEVHQHEKALRWEAELRRQERDEFERREHMARAEADAHREHLHALFMKAPVAIAILQGPQLRFVLANPKFEQLVEKSSLVGRPGREAIPEPEAGPTWEVLQTVQRSGDPFLGNEYPSLWGQSSPGEQRYFNFVAQPTKGEKGKFDSVMVHAVEVTDSVLSERRRETLLALAPEQGQPRGVTAILSREPKDIPFSLLYVADEPGPRYAEGSGISQPPPGGVPAAVSMAFKTNSPVLIEDVAELTSRGRRWARST